MFLHERIFAPLGMKDTGFHVPEDKLDRLPACDWTDMVTGELVVLHQAGNDCTRSRRASSPAGSASSRRSTTCSPSVS